MVFYTVMYVWLLVNNKEGESTYDNKKSRIENMFYFHFVP